ncbi:MAG: VOC family protein [Pseudomonadota bacterium]|nr:VOC family protein [Pseudomonadota bacterium]
MAEIDLDRPPNYRGLAHIALVVTDPEKSADWYEDILGLKCVVRATTGCFLSFAGNHHDIALIKAHSEHVPWSAGLHHVSMQIEGGTDEIKRLHSRLVSKGVKIDRVVDHSIGWGLYFYDPDGNRLEFFYERPGLSPGEGQKIFRDADAPSRSIDISELD